MAGRPKQNGEETAKGQATGGEFSKKKERATMGRCSGTEGVLSRWNVVVEEYREREKKVESDAN